MIAAARPCDDRWRTLLAAVSSGLTALCAAGGLFTIAPSAQTGVLAGLAAGMVAPAWLTAALAGAAGAAFGVLLGPANAWYADGSVSSRMLAAAIAIPVAAAVSAGARVLIQRRGPWPKVILGVAVALVIANMWMTTFDVNDESAFDPTSGTQMPSFWQQLDGPLPSQLAASDEAWFFGVYERVRAGGGYYATFDEALRDNPRWAPTSVTQFRMPTLFWLWSLLPGARAIVVAFLILASVAIACVLPVVGGAVKLPLAVPACTALAAYFVYFPVQLPLFSQEQWAVCLAIASLAAFSLSLRSERWRLWVVAAVTLAVLGTLIRETMIFVPVAGLVSAFVGRERRGFRVGAWAAGVAVWAAAYLAHYLATRPYVSPDSGPSQFVRGGVDNVLAAVAYATDMLGSGGALAVGLVLLGVAGVLLLPDRSMRTFAAVATLAPLLAFVFIGNRAWYETTGERINYWGATVVPLLYALVPVALRVLPCAAVQSSQMPDGARTMKMRAVRVPPEHGPEEADDGPRLHLRHNAA